MAHEDVLDLPRIGLVDIDAALDAAPPGQVEATLDGLLDDQETIVAAAELTRFAARHVAEHPRVDCPTCGMNIAEWALVDHVAYRH
jgi:hypothetical protein